MTKKKPKCETCAYRNTTNFSIYKCNYVGMTGHTRKAVPPERCTHYRPEKESNQEQKQTPIPVYRPTYDWDLARELYQNGRYDKEIANELGCKRETVRAWRERNGLPGVRKRTKGEN